MKRIGMLSALLACALLAGHAQAQSTATNYLGASGAAVWTDGARQLATLTGGVHDDQIPNGFKVFAGRIWDRYGLEFGYYNLGEYEILNAANAVQDRMDAMAFAVSGVYSAPLGQGYFFNAKLGIAITQVEYECVLLCAAPFVDTTRRGTSGLVGIGFAWRGLGDNLSLRMDFEHFGSVQQAVSTIKFKDGYDMFSVGLQLHF